MLNPSPKPPKTNPVGRIASAGVGATAAAAYAFARGQSPAGCLMVVSTAVVLTLVLDELGWV